MKILQISCLILCSLIYTALALPKCQDIEIVYPKENIVIEKSKDPSTYLVIGNTSNNSKLLKVSLLHVNSNTGDNVSKEVWTGNDQLLKVSAIQQELNDLDFDLPNKFWFSTIIEQNGAQCQYESEKFEITA